MAERFRALAERRGVEVDAVAAEAAEMGAVLMELESVIRARLRADPGESYAAKLLQGPEDSLLKKLGERGGGSRAGGEKRRLGRAGKGNGGLVVSLHCGAGAL